MALTPQNNDAFFREVDEDLRRDQVMAFVHRWGRVLALVIGLALVLLGAFLWWRARDNRLAGEDSVALAPAIQDLGQGKLVVDTSGIAKAGASRRAGFQAVAKLAMAANAVEKGDVASAVGQYAAIAADDGLAQPFRDLATVRGVALQYDSLPPQQVIDRLKGLAIIGNPWFGSAGELTALAWLKLGKKDKAGQLFASIARDEAVPTSLRGRAAGMATALGQPVRPAAQTVPKG